MGYGGTEEDGFSWQYAIAVFYGFLHKFFDYQGVGAFVDDLFFQLSAFEVDFFDFFTFKDQLFLVFQTDGAFADAFHLEFGLNFYHLKIAQIRRLVINCFLVGIGKCGQAIFTGKQFEGVVI